MRLVAQYDVAKVQLLTERSARAVDLSHPMIAFTTSPPTVLVESAPSRSFWSKTMPENLFPPGPTRLSDLPSDFLDDPYGSYRSAAMIRRSVLGGRDAPEEHTDPATLASLVVGALPLAGLVDAAGYMPDFRGGVEPSLAENWRQGDRLAVGLQMLGMIPVLGGFAKAARMARKVPDGRWASYADQYPESGPPTYHDKVTNRRISVGSQAEGEALVEQGKAYPRKRLTPTVREFANDRRAIQRDMDENGYYRFFDSEKRAEVDPANYPADPDVLARTMPAKLETAAKYRELYRTNGAVDRLIEAYQKGKDAPAGRLWYALRQVEEKFIEEYGPQMGRQPFRERFVGPIAATTAGNSPRQNHMAAHYAAYEDTAGRRLSERADQYPYPVGGPYPAQNSKAAQSYFDDGEKGFDEAKPKRYAFDRAMLGDRDVYVVDRRISRAIDPEMDAPRYYALATEVMEEARKRVGAKDAREFNDAVWAGLGSHHDLLDIDEINQMIERTHRLTGMPRDEIVKRGLVRQEIPMYGIGGVLLAPAAGYGAMNSGNSGAPQLRGDAL